MDSLFGISMDVIMWALVAIFAVGVAAVGYIAVTNRTMFKMGLRNLPRRGLQIGLVVMGLMLATLITTASFTTGDTVDHSITKITYDMLQRSDLAINFQGEDAAESTASNYAPESAVTALESEFVGDADIDGFLPFLQEPVSAQNPRSRLSEPSIVLSGVDPERLGRLGGLRLVGGGAADLSLLASNAIFLSDTTADDLDAVAGDTLTIFVGTTQSEVTVVGIVEDEFASGVAGGAMLLSSVQSITNHPGQVNHINIALKGGVRGSVTNSDAVALRVQSFVREDQGWSLLGIDGAEVTVDTIKQDALEEAQATAGLITSFFLLLGLFSIASGVMLIFMIFVMLAAERKAEMGMARAVGAQRSNLVQSFVSEGMAYNLIAGAIGAALGVAVAFILVVGFLRWSGGEEFAFLEANVTMRSLIISYCLGVSITFVTVVMASFKVSNVNIVSAIRGLDDEGQREARRKTNWKWVAAGVIAMIVPPLGIWFLFCKGFSVPWAWILAPIGVAIGGLAILGAKGGGSMSEFLAAFGFAIVPLSLAMLASYYRVNGRVLWTVVGAYLAAYWLLPFNIAEEILGTELQGDLEMFLLAGIMVVLSFTLIIIFNAKLLTTLFQRRSGSAYLVPSVLGLATLACVGAGIAFGDSADSVGQVMYLFAALVGLAAATSLAAARVPQLAPALKMGVAYPLANRFRTGMTIAMFSLIVFSIVTFSVVSANFNAATTGSSGDGGWDVVTTSNRNNPVQDVPQALSDVNAEISAAIVDTGRVTLFIGNQQVRRSTDDALDWNTYPVIAGDDAFFAAEDVTLDGRATGYETDRAVLDAVRSDKKFALVDGADWGPYDILMNPNLTDDTFEPFEVTIKDPVSEKSATVTVIGVLASKLPGEVVSGVYVNESAYTEVFGTPDFLRTYIRLDDSIKPVDGARDVEAALSTHGVQAEGISELISESAAQDRAFNRMFQAFMTLGLFVGITALGVIAFRSVVERRQQIGMLRAIGYQSSTVALTFVLESTFIALMGILSGVVGGVLIARNLFTTGQFAGEGIEFSLPWMEILPFTAAALFVSLLMTWLPSRNAARVPVADALRYE